MKGQTELLYVSKNPITLSLNSAVKIWKSSCFNSEVVVAQWLVFWNLETVVVSLNLPSNGNKNIGVSWYWGNWTKVLWKTKNIWNFIDSYKISRHSLLTLKDYQFSCEQQYHKPSRKYSTKSCKQTNIMCVSHGYSTSTCNWYYWFGQL